MYVRYLWFGNAVVLLKDVGYLCVCVRAYVGLVLTSERLRLCYTKQGAWGSQSMRACSARQLDKRVRDGNNLISFR